VAIPAFVLACLSALLLSACGTESNPNDPRPPAPAEITVNIGATGVRVQPPTAGVNNKGTANLSQNHSAREPQSDEKAPLDIHFTIVNGTTTDTKLEVRQAGQDPHVSPLVVAQGNANWQVSLPTGTYTVDAADIPAAKPAPFTIGPLRTSSQQDLLLP